jgi:cytochrome c-type biogenesis protein
MGLQLLELIRIPLPSLDFKWRNAVMFESRGIANTGGGGGGTKNTGSLFDENGGLLLGNLQSNNNIRETSNSNGNDDRCTDPSESTDEVAALIRMFLLGGTSALVASPCATPVLASLLAYLASVSSSSENIQSLGTVWNGASWMLSYTLGYSTLLFVAGATGGQALVNLRKARDNGTTSALWQWITPLTGGVLIAFGMNGLLVALLGDPSLSALAPILE